jgi:hypothetical protein
MSLRIRLGVGLGVGFGILLGAGCAATPQSGASARWFGPGLPLAKSCVVETPYTDQAVTKIVRMREAGESLRTVAAEVGGTRKDVKCAERSARTGQRNAVFVQLGGH